MSDLGTYITHSGQTVNLRLIRPEDITLLVDMFHRLSPESKRLRFHLYTTRVPEEMILREATSLSELDTSQRVAIIATVPQTGGREEAVGVARFVRTEVEDDEAEVAIVVRDDFQRKGLGKHLLRTLAAKAREVGVAYFTGWIMAYNIRLIRLIKSMEEVRNVEADSRHGEIKIRAPI